MRNRKTTIKIIILRKRSRKGVLVKLVAPENKQEWNGELEERLEEPGVQNELE